MMNMNFCSMVLASTWLMCQLTVDAKHVPVPDELSGELVNFNKHTEKRMSQWYHKLQKRSCGEQAIEPVNPGFKIIGGKPTEPGSWPWMVTIWFAGCGHVCGGSLIDKQWILTAAHCMDPILSGYYHYSDYKIRLGKSLLYEVEQSEQSLEIENVISHPLYDLGTLDYDIALVKLKTPVEMTKRVSPICLPSLNHQPLPHWVQCVVTGWGATNTEELRKPCPPPPSPVLRQVSVPIISRARCEMLPVYRGSLSLTEREFCAGYMIGGRDSCAGDSGGPLQYEEASRWYIKGIVSRGGANGSDCGHPMRPGIYTDVFQFVPWVLWEMFLYS